LGGEAPYQGGEEEEGEEEKWPCFKEKGGGLKWRIFNKRQDAYKRFSGFKSRCTIFSS
jgi:hypothetical protein